MAGQVCPGAPPCRGEVFPFPFPVPFGQGARLPTCGHAGLQRARLPAQGAAISPGPCSPHLAARWAADGVFPALPLASGPTLLPGSRVAARSSGLSDTSSQALFRKKKCGVCACVCVCVSACVARSFCDDAC